MGEKCMKRVIMHIDMNSYFASVEQQVKPSFRGKPVAVGGPNEGRTVIAAASIEAKRFGVKSGMNIYQARKICPNLIFVQGDYRKYAEFTNRIFYIFRRYTPILEIFSIDEAFLDVTDTLKTFENAIRASKQIKQAIKREVGDWLSCSVGIAPNKLIAKLASDLKKPDGLVVVKEKDIFKLLNHIELDELCGIGSRTKKNLLSLGIDTIGKLGATPVEVLVRRFGKMGLLLHCMGKGEDESPVVPYYEIPEPKSMGHSYTLPEDTSDKGIIWSTLLKLSEQVGRRLRAEKFYGRRVSAVIRTGDFLGMSRQKALNRWTNDGYDIFLIAREIIESFHYSGPVRLIGVSISGLVKGVCQLSFLPEEIKAEKLIKALDAINNRFGEFTIGRASLMLTKVRKGPSGLGINRAMSRNHRNEDKKDDLIS
jgi:DNA polymerase IV